MIKLTYLGLRCYKLMDEQVMPGGHAAAIDHKFSCLIFSQIVTSLKEAFCGVFEKKIKQILDSKTGPVIHWTSRAREREKKIFSCSIVVVVVVVMVMVFNVLRSFLVLVPKCPALTVGYLVKTSPNSCVTSQMKTNTTCSFSCPKGYQLRGPSYKTCEANGNWTDSAKSVSCSGEL